MKSFVPIVVSAALAMVGCAQSRPAASVPATAAAAGNGVACSYPVDGEPARPVDPPPSTGVSATGTVSYTLTMPSGRVTFTADRARAACTVNSFDSLVRQGFYNETRCHRLADSGLFMLQCGDPTGSGSGGPGYSFADEVDPHQQYPAGTVAMANAGPDTNGSQFFIVYQDSALPPSYTAWAKLDAASLKVVQQLAAKGQDGSFPDGTGRPLADARIISVSAG